jgi:hypothetical protein
VTKHRYEGVFCTQKQQKIVIQGDVMQILPSMQEEESLFIPIANNAKTINEKVSPSLLSQTIYMSISVSVLLQLNLFISKSSTEGSPGCNCGGPSRPIE